MRVIDALFGTARSMDDTLVPTTSQQNAPAASAADSSAGGAKPATQVFHDKDGPSFSDLLDIINPLQHIPIINTLYQKLTGDEEGAAADVAGGALWGGLIGVVVLLGGIPFFLIRRSSPAQDGS